MNWQHVRTFLWLRWRLLVNHWWRGGSLNAVLMMIVAVGALAMAIPLFIACFVLGLFAFPKATPVHLLYAADGLIVAFLFFWSIGLLTQLQRTETLSLSKLLHLPVSVNGAFLINYVSSLLSLSLVVFVPVMVGFALALILTKGVLLLAVLPLLAAFLLMVTALTYQFQGWLASLMANPRRRRTVIVVATAAFVLFFQLPNLLNLVAPWSAGRRAESAQALSNELNALQAAFQAQEFDAHEHLRRQQEAMKRHQIAKDQARRESNEKWHRTGQLVNRVLPIGWLPLGVMAAAEGDILPALLGFSGMTLIGAASLWRAYRTTLRMYQGSFTARKGRPTAALPSPKSTRKPGMRLLEMRLPGVSEPVSAIALGSLQSLLRAPEAKMMLMTPVLMATIFGAMILRQAKEIPDLLRPLLAFGAMALVLFGVLQLMANQFSFDRDGFRVFVLCAAPRRDILLGKNLAFAPLALGMAAILVLIVQVFCPLRWDHLLAMLPQFVAMFLLFCMLANLLSIVAPMPIAAGSLKPATPKLVPVLLQVAMFTCFFPLTQLPTLLPLGIEALLESQGWSAGVPICLLLSLAQCAAIVLAYRFVLNGQGRLLHAREKKILDVVTNRAA